MKFILKKITLVSIIFGLTLAFVGCSLFGTTTTTTTTAATTTTTTATTTNTTTTTTTTTMTTTMSDTQKVQAVLDGIDLGDLTAVSANLTLPTSGDYGVMISWSSSNQDVISNDGEVTLGAYTADGDQLVILAATATLNDVTLQRTFTAEVILEDAATFFTRAGASIIINNADQIVSDFTVPSEVLGAEVTWASSNTDVATISADTDSDGFYTVTITRPSVDDGGANTSVNLTATITVGDESQDAVKTIYVIAEPPAAVYTDFATLHSTASVGDYIKVTGVVYTTFSTGCFIKDSNGDFLSVYYGSSSPFAGSVVNGDEVELKGYYGVYHTLYQISGIVSQTILSTGNDATVTPIVLTDAKDLFNVDYSDRTTAGQVYQITVTPKILGSYNNVYLFQGEDRVATVYYASNSAAVDALKAEAGKLITINVVYYTWYTGSSVLETGVGEVYAIFDGTANDITEVALTGQPALDADTSNLIFDSAAVGGQTIYLPDTGGYGSSIAWAVTAGTDYATIASGKVTFADVTAVQSVTLTATLTLDTLTPQTKDFVVTVNPIVTSTIADVLALDPADKDTVQIEGTVYAIIQDGYFVFDSTGMINVYVGNGNVPNTLALGDEVKIFGLRGAYHGLDEITNSSIKETMSTGNAYAQTPVVYDGSQTFENGQTYTVTGMVKVEGSYNNVYLYDSSDVNVGVFYHRSPASSIAALKAVADTGISITFDLIYDGQDSGGGNQFIFVGGPADITLNDATDVQAVQAALDSVNIPSLITADTTLELPATLFGVALTYSSDDTTHITDAGVVTITAGSQFTVNITVDAALNAETDQIVIPVQVGEMPLTSIADVVAASSGDFKTQGVVLADEYYHTYFIQDDTGSIAAHTGDSTLLAFFASNIGNKVEVIGSRSTYNGLNELNVDSATFVATASVPAAVNVDSMGFDSLAAYQGQWIELTGLTVSDIYTDHYGNMTITMMNVSDGSTIKMKWDSRVTLTSNDLTTLAVGDKVDVQAVLGWKNGPLLFYTEDAVVTVGTPETDATLLAADAMLFNSSETLTGDYMLPYLNFSSVTTVVISSGLTSNVTDDVTANNKLVVVQPTGADVTGTVTFTLTRGTDTLDVVVNITVSQAVVTAGSLMIWEAYGGGGNSGSIYTNDYVVLYNGTDSSIDLTGYSIQYASKTGTSWQVTELTGSIAAGAYYLIQENAGSGGTTALPTPNVIGTISMGGSGFKLALLDSTTAITGGDPSADANVLDYVGCSSTASFYEGTGPAPAPSNSTSIIRSMSTLDTDDNSADFTTTTTDLSYLGW